MLTGADEITLRKGLSEAAESKALLWGFLPEVSCPLSMSGSFSQPSLKPSLELGACGFPVIPVWHPVKPMTHRRHPVTTHCGMNYMAQNPKSWVLGLPLRASANLWFLGFCFPTYRSRASSHMTLKALPGSQDFLSTAIGSDPAAPVRGPILVNSSPGLDFITGPGVSSFSWVDLGATDVRASDT